MKILNIVSKIFFSVITIVLLLVVVMVVYNFFQISVLNKKYSNLFGYTFFEVTTGSMSNTIEINDVVIVKITKDIKIDDIITYINDDVIITHRVVEQNGEQIITKGDANNDLDKPIQRDMVLGKVVKTIPRLGIWFKVFTDIKVIISIIITIILFGLSLSSKREGKQMENNSFSKFMRKRREKRNEESKKKKTN